MLEGRFTPAMHEERDYPVAGGTAAVLYGVRASVGLLLETLTRLAVSITPIHCLHPSAMAAPPQAAAHQGEPPAAGAAPGGSGRGRGQAGVVVVVVVVVPLDHVALAQGPAPDHHDVEGRGGARVKGMEQTHKKRRKG